MHDAYIGNLQGILGYYPHTPPSGHDHCLAKEVGFDHFLAEDLPPVNRRTETLKT